MQKIFKYPVFGLLIIFSACHSKENTELQLTKPDKEVETIFPVTDFLKGQLRELDTMPVTPLKTVTINGKTDSIWQKRDSIRVFAAPFLTPVIDSISMSPYFSEKSFLDQTINAITFSYDAKIKLPESLKLRHWDVYIDPQRGTVQRIYMVKESEEGNASITRQFTWKANQWCSIRTIKQEAGKVPEIKEEKLTWDFND